MKKLLLFIFVIIVCFPLTACESNTESMVMSKNFIEMREGESTRLSVFVSSASSATTISWKSGDSSIASVDGNGNVTAHSPGRTNIIASIPSGIMAVCEIVVTEGSAYNKLNKDEKKFVDAFLKYAMNSFKDPSSVVIRKVGEYDGNSSTGGAFWGIEVSSTNSFGGTTIQAIFIVKSSGRVVNGGTSQLDSLYHDSKYDCDLITKAIHEKY